MKKRIFTLFLLLAVVVGLFPAAMAAGTEQITVRFYNESCKQKSIDEIKKVPQILRG